MAPLSRRMSSGCADSYLLAGLSHVCEHIEPEGLIPAGGFELPAHRGHLVGVDFGDFEGKGPVDREVGGGVALAVARPAMSAERVIAFRRVVDCG